MNIIWIDGGLGNQMFQYAFAVALKKENPDEAVYVDTHHFNYLFVKKYKTSNLHNGYELEKLFSNIDIEKAPISMLMKVTNYIPNFLYQNVKNMERIFHFAPSVSLAINILHLTMFITLI